MLNKTGKYRVGIVGIYHESNTFFSKPTSWEDFEKGHLLFGEEIVAEYQGAYHEIGGMLEGLSESCRAVPVMYAEATPGGLIKADTADKLIKYFMEVLEKNQPLHGILVAPHGAAVSEQYPDFDGHWLQLLRDKVGPKVPIIGTLDPHANVSHQMAAAADALIAYKTNPHVDQREVGKQAAKLMTDTLAGKIKPVQQLQQSGVAISIEQQHTSAEPCRSLYHLSGEIQATEGVLSSSVLLGFPYADVPEMGSGFLVVTDHNKKLAMESVHRLDHYIWEHRRDFSGKKVTIEEGIAFAKKADKPVLMLDMGDNVGGGSPGDSTFLLHALEQEDDLRSFICLYDPEAVQTCRQRQPGDSLTLAVGGKTDDQHGMSFFTEARLVALVDGRFTETEPRHGGQVHFDMGPTAIVETPHHTTLMLTKHRIVPFSLQQLIHFSINPADYDVLVAKGVHAPVAAYGPVCKSMIRVNTPGVTQADMRKFHYQHRRKPLFPFEENLADL